MRFSSNMHASAIRVWCLGLTWVHNQACIIVRRKSSGETSTTCNLKEMVLTFEPSPHY